MADALRGGLIINEILPQPVAASGGYDTDGNGTAHANDEFIEFFNSSEDPIDISGLQLWDPGWGNWFTFPPDSVLPAGGYAVVVTNTQTGGVLPDADLSFAVGRSALINNTGGDHIVVRDPTANEYITASYDNPPALDVDAIPGFPAGQTQIGTGENFWAMIPGESIQRIPNGGDAFDNDIAPTPGDVNLCFASGTMIETPRGARRIEELRVSDVVITARGEQAVIRWLGAKKITIAEAAANPALWPVTFEPGSLGNNLPTARLQLSQQHRVLVTGPISERIFGTSYTLIAAKEFSTAPNVCLTCPEQDFWYYHIMCDQHEVVLANGASAETLYLGRMAKGALSAAALDEIFLIFPDLVKDEVPEPAYLFGQGKRARKLIERHVQNSKPMQSVP